ncbi:hypothetical protein DBR17_19105 [Sphingomonas sp. HMWF008]|nr:hypothetical protein DBR17_19105 [Sphingomonas sp. HMWF008]
MLTLDDQVCADRELLSTTVDKETVVLDIASGVYLNLNAMGSEILQRLSVAMTLRDLCRDLSRDFNGPLDQVEREVVAFATRLEDAGLIRIVA